MLIPGSIPVTWNLSELESLDYERVPLRSSQTPIEIYTSAGHSAEHITVDVYFEPKPFPPGIAAVLESFGAMNNVAMAVNRLPPGHYLPWHIDGYDRYRSAKNIDPNAKIFRALVMAENALPGQYLHIDNRVHYSWCAGDVYCWVDRAPHASYNFSTQNRYVFQITASL